MIGLELLAYASKQLAQIRCVGHPIASITPAEETTSFSNHMPLGDLSDYSTLSESLHDLRYAILSQRNEQIPVNRLPVEIMMFICELTLLGLESEFAQPDNTRVFCVIKLTHVCRRWRSLLISLPKLWTNFRVIKAAPKFVAECIQRSKSLPIHVSVKWKSRDIDYHTSCSSANSDDGSVEDDYGKTDSDGDTVDEDGANQTPPNQPKGDVGWTSSHSTLSVYPDHHDGGYSWTAYIKEARGYYCLIQQSHRIATLDIFLPDPADEIEEEDNPLACGLLMYPLPALQTLRLRYPRGVHGSIPRTILDQRITTIKNLYLENISLTQIFGLSLNATSLTLRSPGANVRIDTGSFLQFLVKNQNLRSLALHNYQFNPAPNSAVPAALSNLRHLDFTMGSAPLPRHSAALPPGPQSFFRMEIAPQPPSPPVENSTAGTPTSVPSLLLGGDPNPDRFLAVISGISGAGWEQANRVVVDIPIGGWRRGFVDWFLGRLTGLTELSVECRHDHIDPFFDSLRASKERCPKLRRVRIGIAPEHFPDALRSVRSLVKQRAEDGIPLEAVERTDASLFAAGIWNDLYDQWRIEDYLKTRD